MNHRQVELTGIPLGAVALSYGYLCGELPLVAKGQKGKVEAIVLDDQNARTSFRSWVEIERGNSKKAASDVASRVARAERTLGTSIEKLVGKGLSFREIQDLLEKKAVELAGDGSAQRRADQRRAVRLYCSYLDSI